MYTGNQVRVLWACQVGVSMIYLIMIYYYYYIIIISLNLIGMEYLNCASLDFHGPGRAEWGPMPPFRPRRSTA